MTTPDQPATDARDDAAPGGDVPEQHPAADELPTEPSSVVAEHWRRFAVGIVVLRFAIPLAAIPLIPLLIVDRVPLLVLLRPQKEFLLLGGGQLRVRGEPDVWLLFAAYVPLMILAIWGFFLFGRAYGHRVRSGDGPAWLHRAVPPQQLELAQRVLARRGPAILVLGRIAAMPPTVMAAAAGLSDLPWRRYLVADTVGALLAFTVAVSVGYALGRAYEEGGIWLTAGGVVMFLGLVLLLTRWIRAEADRDPSAASATV